MYSIRAESGQKEREDPGLAFLKMAEECIEKGKSAPTNFVIERGTTIVYRSWKTTHSREWAVWPQEGTVIVVTATSVPHAAKTAGIKWPFAVVEKAAVRADLLYADFDSRRDALRAGMPGAQWFIGKKFLGIEIPAPDGTYGIWGLWEAAARQEGVPREKRVMGMAAITTAVDIQDTVIFHECGFIRFWERQPGVYAQWPNTAAYG